MDVLRPELTWVDGRCYRKLVVQSEKGQKRRDIEEDEECETSSRTVEAVSQASTVKSCFNDDEPSCNSFEGKFGDEANCIEDTSRGLTCKITVPTFYYRFIIGKGGETKRRLENENQVRIYVPNQRDDGPIILTGKNADFILSTRRKIFMLVESARLRQSPTHFLSIPFDDVDVRLKFVEFREKVLAKCRHCRGLDESIFIAPEKLHLTISVMVLMSDSERQDARDALPRCYNEIIEPFLGSKQSLKVELRGLNYMNDDPSEVDVLYAKVRSINDKDPTELQLLVDRISSYFASKNLTTRSKDSVKLHVTLMNTKYRSNSGYENSNDQQQQWYKNKRETFDATQIFKNFGTFNFGVQNVTSLHVSQRHAFGKDGYYMPTAKVDFLFVNA